MTHTYDWITVDSISVDLGNGEKESLIHRLVHLLENTKKVSDSETVEKDILKREAIASTQISEHLTVPHAHTNGVNGFCVSIGIVEKKEIFMMIAYDTLKEHNLTLLAELIEVVNNEKSALLCAKSPKEIYDLLTSKIR